MEPTKRLNMKVLVLIIVGVSLLLCCVPLTIIGMITGGGQTPSQKPSSINSRVSGVAQTEVISQASLPEINAEVTVEDGYQVIKVTNHDGFDWENPVLNFFWKDQNGQEQQIPSITMNAPIQAGKRISFKMTNGPTVDGKKYAIEELDYTRLVIEADTPEGQGTWKGEFSGTKDKGRFGSEPMDGVAINLNTGEMKPTTLPRLSREERLKRLSRDTFGTAAKGEFWVIRDENIALMQSPDMPSSEAEMRRDMVTVLNAFSIVEVQERRGSFQPSVKVWFINKGGQRALQGWIFSTTVEDAAKVPLDVLQAVNQR